MSVKFGIGMATYQRADGTTPDVLSRALQSIAAQTYKDYVVYVIGDHYGSDMGLWGDIYDAVGDPPHIKYIDLPFAAEREAGVTGTALWHSGGVFAINFALAWMRCDGVDVYAHLDHDDWWEPNHLELLAKEYEDHDVAFAYTCAKHLKSKILPANAKDNPPPRPSRVVHSTVSWRLKQVPLNYEVRAGSPSDAHMWSRMAEYCKAAGLKTRCVDQVTVHHESEGM